MVLKTKIIKVFKKNPQANANLERIHQVVGDMLRSKDLSSNNLDAEDLLSEILSSIAWDIRSIIHTMLNASLKQLVYNKRQSQ